MPKTPLSTEDNRDQLEARYGKVWATDDLIRDFEVLGFVAPWVSVRRKQDGQSGSLRFQHMPRYYFGWVSDAD